VLPSCLRVSIPSLYALFVACIFICQLPAKAASANDIIGTTQLALAPTWIKLGRYEPSSASPSRWRSAIHSSDFFLHAEGRDNPALELDATLAAFGLPATGDVDRHAQCRFPARLLWLRANIPQHPSLRETVSCRAYQAWTRDNTISSVSVVFATGFFDSPASYFGHTLLKFNYRGEKTHTRLLDVSVNYGAIVEKDANPLTYIYKSLTGGYDGGFSHIQFYFHNHNYGEAELRDMWEYRLNLPQQDVDLIVAHAWEVLGKRYTYYFFRHNCAFRMAEVVEIVDGLSIIPRDAPWIIPQALVQSIGSARYKGAPVLDDAIYLPSRQSRFYEKFSALSRDEAAILRRLATREYGFAHAEFASLDTPAKQAILDALLDYYQFVGHPMDKAAAKVRASHAAALSMRFALPPGERLIASQKPTSPHFGRRPGLLQVGFAHVANAESRVALRYRGAYYDQLDSDVGHVRNSALIMGDAEIHISSRRIIPMRVTLITADSVSPGLSGLKGDTSIATKFGLGAEQLRLFCQNCFALRANADYGMGKQLTDHLFVGGYIGAVLHGDRASQGWGFARASVDMIVRHGNHFSAKVGYEERQPAQKDLRRYAVTRVEARWAFRKNSDLRLLVAHDKVRTTTFSLGSYW
jgi:hypothetical protein